MQSLSEKIVQGVLLEAYCIVGEKKWKKLIEFVESELAVEHTLAPDGLHCPVCQQVAGTYLACSYCHSEITPAGKA